MVLHQELLALPIPHGPPDVRRVPVLRRHLIHVPQQPVHPPEELDKDNTKAEDVRPVRHIAHLPPDRLGGEVTRGAPGEGAPLQEGSVDGERGLWRLREAKVGEHDGAAPDDEEVVGLDVRMDDVVVPEGSHREQLCESLYEHALCGARKESGERGTNHFSAPELRLDTMVAVRELVSQRPEA